MARAVVQLMTNWSLTCNYSNACQIATSVYSLSNIFACISPITSTKNIGSILMQNEDLNALKITGTMNHIISISVTQCQSKWHYNYYSVQNRVYHRACRCNTDNNDT